MYLSRKEYHAKKVNSNRSSLLSRSVALGFFLFLMTVLFYFNIRIKGGISAYFGVYGSIMVCYLLGKMVLSFWYKPRTAEPIEGQELSVVIPCYNEKPEAVMKTVESVLYQDIPVKEIFVVDDGSEDQSAYKTMLKMKKEHDRMVAEVAAAGDGSGTPMPELIVHRRPENQGKRHVQIWAFKRATGNLIVTIDSDTYLYRDAIRELIKPFNDPEVKATTGHVSARNREDSLFTRLIDMRYDNAFRVERSAQSVTGNILVCSGCFSAYRKDVIMKNLDHYESQTFLGEPVQFGDDRCLTNYAILEGKTIYQSTARCMTDVPANLMKFLKQQIRWNKSFFRESLIALTIGFKKPKMLPWVVLEMLLWFLFGVVIIGSVLVKSVTMGWLLLIYYLFYLSLSAYARNVFYILRYPHIYFLAPLYGLIHVCLLFPLRFYALATIKSNGWGTR